MVLYNKAFNNSFLKLHLLGLLSGQRNKNIQCDAIWLPELILLSKDPTTAKDQRLYFEQIKF